MSRSSNWSRQHASDEDFTRAAWDTARDVELNVRGLVVVELTLSQQRGVWVSRAVLRSRVEGTERSVWATTESSYPNARAASLSAFLFSQMNTLNIMGDAAFQDALKERMRRA